MKQRLKKQAGSGLAFASSLLPDRPRVRNMTEASTRHSVLMTAPFGSMGDQALAGGVLEVAERKGLDVNLLVPGAVDPWIELSIQPVQSVSPMMSRLLMYPSSYASELFQSSEVIVIGADTIDGRYESRYLAFRVRALNLAAMSGRPARLVNFSISTDPTPLSLRLLRSLRPEVELWSRDEVSRLRAAELLQREVSLAPDVGLFLRPNMTPRVYNLRDGGQEDKPRAILVPNAHIATDFGVGFDELREFWVSLSARLSENFEVIIMPHDTRPSPDDVGFSTSIEAEATRRGQSVRVFVPESAAEAKALLSVSSLCVSARMHACVGSLSSGVPTVGLDYLQKFEGQFKWFPGLGQTIDFSHTLRVDMVLAAANRVQDRQPISQQLSSISENTIGWLS